MKLKIKLAQVDLIVGDFQYNYQKIKNIINESVIDKTDILVLPEMSTTGYYPEDLLYKQKFIKENIILMKKLAGLCTRMICIIGFVNQQHKKMYNSAAVIHNKKIIYTYNKIHLPNYSVFDEKRYFQPGDKIPVFQIRGVRFGLGICEDTWVENSPASIQARYGKTDFIININASPYYIMKYMERKRLLSELARKTKNYIFYSNIVGGQDEVVFDGNSLIFDKQGKLIKAGRQFKEDMIDLVLDLKENKIKPDKKQIDFIPVRDFQPHQHNEESLTKSQPFKFLSQEAEIYQAVLTGTRDYIRKNHFSKVVVGLSGGIDSALTTAIAVDAIGRDNVLTLFMPSRYSSKKSYQDARHLADNLGIRMIKLPINRIHQIYLKSMKFLFKNLPADITEENIQARIRGNLLMAVSNKFGYLVLTTGNKSEMSTGYATLYGDLAGGFAVLKDIYKTMVYRLTGYRNQIAGFNLIPDSIIKKAPTAELRKNQQDSDSLPDYTVLDKILYYYIEEHLTFTEILKITKLPASTVKKTIRLVDQSEYKRRQSPPGVKITRLSFGKDRRMPITNGYRLK